MTLGLPLIHPQADLAVPNLKPRMRRATVLHAQAEALFAEADRVECFRRACVASSNPDGAAIWQRIVNVYRTEAEACIFQADKLIGVR